MRDGPCRGSNRLRARAGRGGRPAGATCHLVKRLLWGPHDDAIARAYEHVEQNEDRFLRASEYGYVVWIDRLVEPRYLPLNAGIPRDSV